MVTLVQEGGGGKNESEKLFDCLFDCGAINSRIKRTTFLHYNKFDCFVTRARIVFSRARKQTSKQDADDGVGHRVIGDARLRKTQYLESSCRAVKARRFSRIDRFRARTFF